MSEGVHCEAEIPELLKLPGHLAPRLGEDLGRPVRQALVVNALNEEAVVDVVQLRDGRHVDAGVGGDVHEHVPVVSVQVLHELALLQLLLELVKSWASGVAGEWSLL